MKNFILTLSTFTFLLLVTTKTFAQVPPPDEDFLTELVGKRTLYKQAGPRSEIGNYEKFASETREGPLPPAFQDPRLMCDGPDCIGSEDPPSPSVGTGVSTSSMNSFGPMAGMSDTMAAMAVANQTTTFLSSPLTLLNVTWRMTEPGVAGGLADAFVQGAQLLNHRYQAENTYITQALSNPNGGEAILAGYQNCVSERMVLGDPWIAAQSFCQGDRSVASPNAMGSVPTAGGFNLTHSPDYNPPAAGGVPPGPTDGGSITALDQVFSPARRKAIEEGRFLDLVDISRRQEELAAYVGDFKFSMTLAGTGVDAGAVKETRITRIEPTKKPNLILKQEIDDSYRLLMRGMRNYCGFLESRRASSAAWSSHRPFSVDFDCADPESYLCLVFRSNDFWAGRSASGPLPNAMTVEDWSNLSVIEGPTFSPFIGDGFMALFFDENGTKNPDQSLPCDLLAAEPGQPAAVEKFYSETASRGIPNYLKVYFGWADKVGKSRWYAKYQMANSELLAVAPQIVNEDLRQYIYALVPAVIELDGAGIYEALRLNAESAHSIVTALKNDRAQNSGKGSALSEVFRSANKAPAT